MLSEILIDSVVFLCSLVLSAFFSAAEVALFSLQPSTLEELSIAERPADGSMLPMLLRKPTVPVGHYPHRKYSRHNGRGGHCCFSDHRCRPNFGWNRELALGIEVVVVTFVVIVLSEVTPKVIAARMPADFFPPHCISALSRVHFFLSAYGVPGGDGGSVRVASRASSAPAPP